MRPSYFYNIFFFFLIMAAGLYLWYNAFSSAPKTSVINTNYDAFATDVVSTKFSSQGEKHYELISPRLNHFKKNNQTYVETPKLYLYNKEQGKWLITAQYALATQGKSSLSFVQDVDISGAETTNHKNTQLLTEKITYYPDQNTASTDLPITIVQPGSIIHAIGMDVVFNTGTITLLSKINGTYNPNEA